MCLTPPSLNKSEPYYNKIYSRHHDMINVIAWSCYRSNCNKTTLTTDNSLQRSYKRNGGVEPVLEPAINKTLETEMKLKKKIKERTPLWF